MTDAQRRRDECTIAGETVKLGPLQCRVVAALLVSPPDRTVFLPDLVPMVWPNPDDEPPGDPLKLLASVVHRLRYIRRVPIISRPVGILIPRERRDYDDLQFCQRRSECRSIYGGLCKGCEQVRRAAEPRLISKRRELLEFVRDHPRATQQQMALALGRQQPRIHQSLVLMQSLGLVQMGVYRSTEITPMGLDLLAGRHPERRRNTVGQRLTREGRVPGITRGVRKLGIRPDRALNPVDWGARS